MRGNIYYIEKHHGFINGQDSKIYFFHKDDLTNCTIYQLNDGDYVEFEIVKQEFRKNDKAIRIRKLSSVIASGDKVNPGINSNFNYDSFNEDERKIISLFKKCLYVTNGGMTFSIANSTYRYFLVKPTEEFSLTFNLNREIVVIFADYVSFEPRSLDAATYVINNLHSKLRIDRGCQIIISNDNYVEEKLTKILKDTNLNSIVIPFTYRELLKTAEKDFIINRFKKYLFDVDLFSSLNPIQNDIFFFGRRDYVYDIVSKCKMNVHSGIFGLRRSGKTSLLYAVKRLLDNDNYPTIYIPCQSQLSSATWQMSLYTIIRDIYKETGIKETNVHSKNSYINENAAVCFENDLMMVYKIITKPVVLLFDEIEAITFDVPNDNIKWSNGEYYVPFWNAIRGFYLKHPQVISVVVAGTNPMINEVPVLKNEISNPMYGQLSKSNQGAYLLPFNFSDTQNMVNTLGGYMGLSFDEHVCSALTIDCGGHPYLIRLLCSFINSSLKTQNSERPIKITRKIYDNYIKKFEASNEANDFYLMILNILISNYPKEFNVLKEIAINGGGYISNFVDDNSLLHLIGYGLIENNDGEYKIRFKTIEHYLLGKYQYESYKPFIEDQKQEIQYRINAAEMSLRVLIKNTLLITKGGNEAKEIVLKAMGCNPIISEKNMQRAKNYSLNQLFDPSVNTIYLSVLSRIILDNLDIFNNIFIDTKQIDIQNHFDIINKARRVPDHSYTDDSINWTYGNFLQFRNSISWLENILKEYN